MAPTHALCAHFSLEPGRLPQVVRLPERSVVDRLIAQSALQPGTVSFYRKVLQFSKQAGFR
eukprot:100636-Chlamydomonas_euryale.AAC.4